MKPRPSSSHIWTQCTGALAMMSRVPAEPEGDAAREGTCAAWVAEMVVTGAVSNPAELIGAAHPENGWVVDHVMAYQIEGYVENLCSHGGDVMVERRVFLNDLVDGTPDGYAVTNGNVLRNDDLKYGFGVVEPYRNTQMMIYTGAIIRSMPIPPTSVVLGIYQPRASHPDGIYRTWSVEVSELMEWVEWIEVQARETQHPQAPLTPGPHCRYCAAQRTCHASAAANYQLFDKYSQETQHELTPQQLAEELRFLENAEKMLKGRTTAIRAEAEARMKRGVNIPGWVSDRSFGHRRWKVPAPLVKMMTGVDPTAGKMVTPKELEDKGADPRIVAHLVETPRTSPNLRQVSPASVVARFNKGR